jgi:hypothetical protein
VRARIARATGNSAKVRIGRWLGRMVEVRQTASENVAAFEAESNCGILSGARRRHSDLFPEESMRGMSDDRTVWSPFSHVTFGQALTTVTVNP